MFKLIPKEEKFFDMFISMAQNAHEASKLLTSDDGTAGQDSGHG